MEATRALIRLQLNNLKQQFREVGKVAFTRYLLLTNVTISTSLSAFGDTMQQHYDILTSENPEKTKWDKTRTFNMAVTGTTVGVICHYWYNHLDKKFPGRAFGTVVRKLLVDQIFFSPLLIVVFFTTVGLLEHSSKQEILDEIKSKAWRLYAAEWIVWPPAQLFNFYLLPTRFRVLYDNTISLGYDVYTSYVKHDKS